MANSEIKTGSTSRPHLHRLLHAAFWAAVGVPLVAGTIHIVNMTEAVHTKPPVTVSLSGAILPLVVAYFLGILACIFRHSPEDRFILFSLGFAIRIVVGLMLAYTYQAQDEGILHLKAQQLIYTRGTTLAGPDGYATVLAVLYSIFGPNLLIPKIVNSLLGAILPFLLYDVTRRLSPGTKAARRVLHFCMFLPPLLLYSGMNLKELPSAFLLGLTIWGLLVPRWRFGVRIAFALLVSVVTYYFRGAWALFPLLATVVYAVLGSSDSYQLRRKLSICRVFNVAFLVLVLLFPLGPVIQGALSHINYRLFIGAYAEFGTLRNAEGSVTRSLLDIERPWSARNLAVQILRAPFSPSPMAVLFDPSPQTFIDSLNAFTQYLLIPFALTALLAGWRHGELLMLALLQIAMLVTIGLSLMLGLTLQRHSVPQFVILYILASIGTGTTRGRGWIFLGWFVLVAFYTLVYAVAKL